MSSAKRADLALVERGLAESRAKAQALIEGGRVTAGGRPVRKASQSIPVGEAVIVAPSDADYVSRGGRKLAAALSAFGVDPRGRECLDLGASTGGFTDVLLRGGAGRVVAVDVGHGQLHPTIAGDRRVLALEGLDARALTAAHLPAPPDLIVADLSFIGLVKGLGAALGLAAARADIVALIKPQFEVGPGFAGKGGLLRDDDAERAAHEVARALDGLGGFRVRGMIDSPIRGGAGAREFLAHAARAVSA